MMKSIDKHNRIPGSNVISLLRRLLDTHGFKVCKSELSILLNFHYAFPSPLSISDVLDDLGIEHLVFYLTEENIGELEKISLPLLCYQKDKNEYFLVQSIERDKDSFNLISSKKGIIEYCDDLLLIAVFIDKGIQQGQMIDKCKTLKLQKSGLLPDKHMDYLVSKDFDLLISLDGHPHRPG